MFWLWFPIGVCGVRTVLLFISSLSIFVLRVGQMHIGSRTTTPQISTLKYLVPLPIIQTLGWYVFSAWWFNEIYAWSSPTEDFAWVKPGRYVISIRYSWFTLLASFFFLNSDQSIRAGDVEWDSNLSPYISHSAGDCAICGPSLLWLRPYSHSRRKTGLWREGPRNSSAGLSYAEVKRQKSRYFAHR